MASVEWSMDLSFARNANHLIQSALTYQLDHDPDDTFAFMFLFSQLLVRPKLQLPWSESLESLPPGLFVEFMSSKSYQLLPGNPSSSLYILKVKDLEHISAI